MTEQKETKDIIQRYKENEDWIKIDILNQLALDVEKYHIRDNIGKRFSDIIVGYDSEINKVVDDLKEIGIDAPYHIGDDNLRNNIQEKIDNLCGEYFRDQIVNSIKGVSKDVEKGTYLFSELYKLKLNDSDIDLNKIYFATFGGDTSFDITTELVKMGILYYDVHSGKKWSHTYYRTPKYVEPILQNIQNYISIPQISDVSSYLKQEMMEKNIPRLVYIDFATRKIEKDFTSHIYNIKSQFDLLYPDEFEEYSYPKAGVIFKDDHNLCFSPLTIETIQKEIISIKKDTLESIRNLISKVMKKLEDKYIAASQTSLRFDNNLRAYVGSIDVGTKKPLGIIITPWLLWAEESYSQEIKFDLNWIKDNKPCLIITSDKLRPSLIRKAMFGGYQDISFISMTESGNHLLSLGKKHDLINEIEEIFESEDFKIEDVTKKVLMNMFPFTREDILEFANIKYTKEGLLNIAGDIDIAKSMLKDDMLQTLCDEMGLRNFASRVKYPGVEEDIPKGEEIAPEIVKKVETKEKLIEDKKRTLKQIPQKEIPLSAKDLIIIGNRDLPKQYGIIGKSIDKKVIIDLNAPHIVFVSGMMGAGKGYTIGVISEMLVGNSIPNISQISKKATIIVMYKPRDDVPSEFWSIRYPNDEPKEIQGLDIYGAYPQKLIEENQFRAFLDPGVFAKYKEIFSSEYRSDNILPLYIDPSTLVNEDWANALAAGQAHDALYIKKIFKILRELPPDFSLDDIIKNINKSDLTEGQKGFARARLEILEEYFQKDDFMNKLVIGGVNLFDFRKGMYMPDDIFTIMTLIISKLQNKKELEKEPFVFIINEAHLYFRKGIAKEFVDTIENLIRRKRHGANWLLLDTHLPDDVDLKVIKLSDIKVLHFSDKTVDSTILKRILEGTDDTSYDPSGG